MQSQLVCNGCRNVLLYPRGAASVRCAVCNIITSAPPLATDMSQLVCAGCQTLLMHANGAVSVQCSCCQTINVARPANQVAHVNCGGCHSTLMYAYGAPSVRCAICQYVTNIGPIPMQMPNGYAATLPSSSTQTPAKSHTVVVENPMSVDGSGKLVSNVAVGVSTERK